MLMDGSELLFAPVSYEKRAVVFFDLLGWRSELLHAGSDPLRIARLAAAVRTLTLRPLPGAPIAQNVEHATFSDNVCNSFPYEPERIPPLIRALASIQYGLAQMGFWVRGAITVGELYHDKDVIFGPALVRAHHLESKIANGPRILIDRECEELQGAIEYVTDSDYSFIDPWTVAFYAEGFAYANLDAASVRRFNEVTGANVTANPLPIPGDVALGMILNRVIAELKNAPDPRVFEKHRWLYDHIAPRLGCLVDADSLMPEKPKTGVAQG